MILYDAQLWVLLIKERVLLITEDVGDAALPPPFESGGEETLFQKGHLGLYCLDSLHPDHWGFIQRGDGLQRLQ